MATLGLVEIVVTLESVYLIQITHVQQMKIVNASMDIIISPKCFKSGPVHSGRNQGFLSNGCIGCNYLVKILAHCAMLQCMSRYNKPP